MYFICDYDNEISDDIFCLHALTHITIMFDSYEHAP